MFVIAAGLVVLLSGLLVIFLWEDRTNARGHAVVGLLTGLWVGPNRERRCALRTHATLSVGYTVVSHALPGTGQHLSAAISQNLSEGGMCLQTFERLAPQTQVKFAVELPRNSAPIRGVGEVMWAQDEARVGVRRTFLIGLQFVQLNPEDRRRLQEVCQRPPTQRHSRARLS